MIVVPPAELNAGLLWFLPRNKGQGGEKKSFVLFGQHAFNLLMLKIRVVAILLWKILH